MNGAEPLKPDTVAVVDDDKGVCDSLKVLLEAHDFVVVTYHSGAEFLADARRRHLGCLIVDHHMPGLSGLDVVSALRREGISPPVVLITARPDAGITERAHRLGVLAVLEKPFPTARLVALIRAGRAGPTGPSPG
jgi:FixJ family two-component response regulator